MSSLKIGNHISVQIEATRSMKDVHSVVFGSSGIIHKQSKFVGEATSHRLSFQATPEMQPKANLVVYYFQPSGEVIYNQIELKFDKMLANHVSGKFISKKDFG